MKLFIIFIEFFLLVFFIIMYINLKFEIRYIIKQLSLGKNNCDNLHIKGHDKSIESLAFEINKIYLACNREMASYRRKDDDLKHAISCISHDLRTPLTSILGYIQLIKRNSKLNEKATKYLDIVELRSTSLNILVNDLFELSLIEDPNNKLTLEEFNLESVFGDVLSNFYHDLQKKNLDVSIDIKADNYMLINDKTATFRVISNLMQNLLRYAKSFVSINLYKNNNEIFLKIKNDGNTLSPKEIERLFDKFYKGDESRTKSGTGLGLSIANILMRKMNGHIDCSVNNDVITFFLTFKTY